MEKSMKELLEAREYALINIRKVPRAPNSDYSIILQWYRELDEKTHTGLIALAVERELKLATGSKEWAEKVNELLEGQGFWEEIALTDPYSLFMIALEIQEELEKNALQR
jgi:rRNA maturation endonuclease Nob1